MEQFAEVVKIRNLLTDTDPQSKRVIELAIDKYDIIPFVPIVHKLRYHETHSKFKTFSPRNILRKRTRTESTETFSNFWMENMKQLSREFYLGKRRKFKERIRITKYGIRLLPKMSEPVYQGSLAMKAEDMKSEMVAKVLLNNYENEYSHFILIDILSQRPLTVTEYISLFIRYPETVKFVDAALGFAYERFFNKIFEKNTGVTIPLTIAAYLADVYPTTRVLSNL